ncbi:YIPF7 protein [Thecamonas trahens ATCC 50062]|uniref:YIPF7 protein n=1 Tax=Thecamonas trahens ATCC 50062 TaxID=461836 RepID=A0A0L0DRC6_THETB|nr:YIPF7 protein [Thecamonas trahens ATCC 50062]KNC54840.1 YIPF7 protein [Thecamonas trahens ATCC 50062]|eukprot:XP_013761737.1 YIPF7 protein [Thecamonas trahens ATCC 50062]
MLNVAFDNAPAGDEDGMLSFGYEDGGEEYSPGIGGGSFDDEPPLLEELGIDFGDIKSKSLAVLHPLRVDDAELARVMDDYDLAGPIVFAALLGFFLLMAGKVHFNIIYGVGSAGCAAIFLLLNMMSESGVSVYLVASVLGYCLLPIVGLSAAALVVELSSWVGMALSALVVAWCTHSASSMFVARLAMRQQRWLVFYPILLHFSTFALITMF